jgi:hypothetical protein
MVTLPRHVGMRGSMNEARVQTVPMAQLLLSRNAHFGKHRLCDMGCVSSSNRYMANAAAAGDEAGTGTDFHPWRWDTTEPGHLGRNAMPWF